MDLLTNLTLTYLDWPRLTLIGQLFLSRIGRTNDLDPGGNYVMYLTHT